MASRIGIIAGKPLNHKFQEKMSVCAQQLESKRDTADKSRTEKSHSLPENNQAYFHGSMFQVYRKASCACGGGCPACQGKSSDLKVSQPNDPTEIEADQIADKVMRMPANKTESEANISSSETAIYRKCDACEDEEETVQRMALPSGGGIPAQSPAHMREAISSGGSPLERTARIYFEPLFGTDFSHVRVHADRQAAESANAINARAYTSGNNVVFGSGEYQPGTRQGKRLLAHELTHVVQQGSASVGPSVIQREDFVPWPGQIGHDVSGTLATTGDIISEQVQRTGDPTYASPGPMLLEFNTRTCALTVRKEINFVRAGTGDNQLSEPAFNELKARILRIAQEQMNGWVTINVTAPSGCTLSCDGGVINVNVVTTEGTGSYSSTLNLHPSYGRENAGNIGDDASDRTIWHELGHIVLGAADEYAESHRPDGTARPESRVNDSDWSIMASEANTRRAIMHARHFSHLPAWLGRRFPQCTFTLNEVDRPIVVEFTPSMFFGGFGSPAGGGLSGGLYYSTGLDIGIPLDRLRRLELILGPRVNFIMDSNAILALLLGLRAGVEGQFGSTGFRLGAFAEGGGVGFTDLGAGTLGTSPYVEGGLGFGYSISGTFNFGVEGAGGGRTSNIVDPLSREVSTEFLPYFRLGLSLSASF